MEFRSVEESNESVNRTEEPKPEGEKVHFGNESEETDFSNPHNKSGSVAPKPSDVRNGELVSLLLAATPPYLYNIPLVPQTFFFSEMLKSFVQAKTERQNLKAQQSHHRRQRKRSWRESTPPKPTDRDKPLELTTPRQTEEKPPVKKFASDVGEKKLSELGNFSVEKLANSSIGAGQTGNPQGNSNESPDVLPPAPPLWYPLLYPPQPPYGIDPLHFFIDLRVSAHFWNRRTEPHEPPLAVSPRSAFRAPSPRQEEEAVVTKYSGKTTRNVHYVISSLKDIYENVERERRKGESGEEEGDEKSAMKEKTDKDLRALIGLELVVDYVKQESDGEDATPPDSDGACLGH